MRRIILLGAVVVLAGAGSFWTQARESHSACSDLFYVERVQAEMREELIEESQFLAALQDGAQAQSISAADQAIYAAAAAKLIGDIQSAEIVGRSKHPSYKDLQTCHLTMEINDPLAEFDLGQSTFFGLFATDRQFEIIARFKINFEDVTGVELQSRIDAQRNDQFVVCTQEENGLITSATMAKLTRRAFDIHEPEFWSLNYNTSIDAPEGGIEPGYIGR